MAASLYKDRFQTSGDDGWVTSRKSTSVSRRSKTTEFPSGQRRTYEVETKTTTDGGLTSTTTTEKRSSIGDNKWIRAPAAKIVTRSKTEAIPSMKLSSVDFGADTRKRGAQDDLNMRETATSGAPNVRQLRVHQKFTKMSEQASAPIAFGATFDAKKIVREQKEAAEVPSSQQIASASAVQQELQQFTQKHMQQDTQQGFGASYGAPDKQKSSMKVTLTSVKTTDTPDHRIQQVTTTTSTDGQVTQQQRVARYGKKVMPDIPPPSNALGGVSYGVTTQQQVRAQPPPPQAQPQVMSTETSLPWQQRTQQTRQITHVSAPGQQGQPPQPQPVTQPPAPPAGQPPLPPWQQQPPQPRIQPPRQAPVSQPQMTGQPPLQPWQQQPSQPSQPVAGPGRTRGKGSDMAWIRAPSPEETVSPATSASTAQEEVTTSVKATRQAFAASPPSGPMSMGATYSVDMITPKKPRGYKPPQSPVAEPRPAPELAMTSTTSTSTTPMSYQHQRQVEHEERLKQQEEQEHQMRIEQLRRLRMQQQKPQAQRQEQVITLQQKQQVSQVQPRQPQPPSPRQMPPSPTGQAPMSPPAQLPPWQQPAGPPPRAPMPPPPHILPPHIRGPVPPQQWQQGAPLPPPQQPPAAAPPGVPRGYRPVRPPVPIPPVGPSQPGPEVRPAGGDARPPWMQGQAAPPPPTMMKVQPAPGQPSIPPQGPPGAPTPFRQQGPPPTSPPAPVSQPAMPTQPRGPPPPQTSPQPAPTPVIRHVPAPAPPVPEAAQKPAMVVLKPAMKATPQPQPQTQPKPELKKVEPRGKLGAAKNIFSANAEQAPVFSFGSSYSASDVKTQKADRSRWQPKTKPLSKPQPGQSYAPEPASTSAAPAPATRPAEQPTSKPQPAPEVAPKPAPKPAPRPAAKPAPASPVIPQVALKQKKDAGWIKQAPVTEQVTLKKTSRVERKQEKGGLETVSLKPLSQDEKELGSIKKGVSRGLASKFQTSEATPISFGATFTPGSSRSTSKQESKIVRRQEKTTFEGGQMKKDIKVTETSRTASDAEVKETTRTTTTTKVQASPSSAVQERSKTEVQVKSSAVGSRTRDQPVEMETITVGTVDPIVLDVEEAKKSSSKVILSPSPKVSVDIAHPLEQATSTRKILKVTTRHGELEEAPATPTTPSTPKTPQTPPLTPQQQKKKLEMEQRRAARAEARRKAGGVSQEVKMETVQVQQAPTIQSSGQEVKQETVQVQESVSAQKSQEVRQEVVKVQEAPAVQSQQQTQPQTTSSSMQVIQEQVHITPAAEVSTGGEVKVHGETVQVHQDQVKVMGQDTGGSADFQIQVAKGGGEVAQSQSGQAGFEIKFQGGDSSGSGEGVQVMSTSGGGQMHVHREVTTTVDGKSTTTVQDKSFAIEPGTMVMDQGARAISADEFFSAGKSAMDEFAQAAASKVQIQEPKSTVEQVQTRQTMSTSGDGQMHVHREVTTTVDGKSTTSVQDKTFVIEPGTGVMDQAAGEDVESHQTIEIEEIPEDEDKSYETSEQNESFTISI